MFKNLIRQIVVLWYLVRYILIRRFNRFTRTRFYAVTSKWQWSNIITNILTLSALIFSIYQNKISDERYFKNETESDQELTRVRNRDARQIQLLIDDNALKHTTDKRDRQNQIETNARLTNQLALLNKSIIAQNKSIDIQIKALEVQNKLMEIQRKSNQSYLKVVISFRKDNFIPLTSYQTDMINIFPIISVANTGNSVAENIIVTTLCIQLDNWTKKVDRFVKNATDLNKEIFLKPKQDTAIYGPSYINGPTDLDPIKVKTRSEAYKKVYDNRNAEAGNIPQGNDPLSKQKRDAIYAGYRVVDDTLRKKYPDEFYKYFVVYKIDYKDSYQGFNTIYGIVKVGYKRPYFGRGPGTSQAFDRLLHPVYVDIDDIRYLKDCITKNKMDYNLIFQYVTDKLSIVETNG